MIFLLLALLWLASPAEAACSFIGSHGSGIYTCTDSGNSVTNGNDFAAVIRFDSGINCGDTVVLAAGAIYEPVGVGPNGGINSFTGWLSCSANTPITIKSSKLASLPAGRRVTYTDVPNMAILQGHSADYTWVYSPRAGGYIFQGIVFQTGNGNVSGGGNFEVPNIVFHNYTDSGAPADAVHDNVYDRVIIRPWEESQPNPDTITVRSAHFGLRMDGVNITVKNSTIDGFCCMIAGGGEVGHPTQSTGIVITSGLGPFTITNNFIGAYGWNILTGGSLSAPTNTATLTSVTNTSATFSNTTGLSTGSIVRFLMAAPLANDSDPGPNTCKGNFGGRVPYGVGKLTSVNSGTGAVTWTWLCNGSGTMCPGPKENPASPGEAGWRTAPRINNITVTRNTFNKRSIWSTGSGQTKSFWEMKEGSNVLFEGNILTGPIDGTSGQYAPINNSFATDQGGNNNPWAESRNNIFRSNLMYGVGAVFPGAYNSYCVVDTANAASNVTWTNNLMFSRSNRNAFLTSIQHIHNHVYTHNTVRGATNAITKDGCGPRACISNNVTFRDNIVDGASYYFNPINVISGLVTDHNMVVDNNGTGCAANRDAGHCNGWTPAATDQVPTSDAAVGFTNLADGDSINGFGSGGNYHSYKLTPGSPGHNAASDGTDIGVNFELLDAALGGPTPSGLSGVSGIVGKSSAQ